MVLEKGAPGGTLPTADPFGDISTEEGKVQLVLTIINSGVEFIKKNWRNIIAAIGFAGVVAIVDLSFQLRDLELTTKELKVARQEYEVAKEQLEYERSLQPKLEYSYQVVFSRADEQVVLDAIEQLSETFYEKVYEYTQTNVDATYLEAVNAVLPLTTTIPARPTEVVVLIQNHSDNISATATKVRLFLTMDRPVTSWNVKSREPYSLVEGDIGKHQIIIEVDRIVWLATA